MCPLLGDLFHYSYKAYFIYGFLKKNEKGLVRSFKFGDCVAGIYSIETETNDTTDTAISASHLNPHIEIDSDMYETLRQKRLFQFSHCELSIYI